MRKKILQLLMPKPNVPKTTSEKLKSKLKITQQKTKASGAKLKQTLFESKNKAFKGDDFTFATKTGKSESNRERYKRIQKENTKAIKGMIDKAFEKKSTGGRVGKMGGGMMGRRFGMKAGTPKTGIQKIKETFATKKKLSPKQMKIAKLAGDPKRIDARDLAKLRGKG